jgi:hypothetical protein
VCVCVCVCVCVWWRGFIHGGGGGGGGGSVVEAHGFAFVVEAVGAVGAEHGVLAVQGVVEELEPRA